MASATKEKMGTSPVVVSPAYPMPGTAPAAGSFLMLPRCTLKVEKQKDGCKILCSCEDQVATYMLQNLCRMLEGGVCGFTCQLNGQNCCTCSLSCGHCSIELTKEGCSITCTSGDQKCCELIQKCCDCLKCCLDCGCTCCITINNTPICCCINM
jgi:hypothetical protein